MALMLFLLLYHKTLHYGLQQLEGQIRFLRAARPLSFYMQDSAYADYHASLRYVEAVKTYAQTYLGLHTARTYDHLFVNDPENETNMWVVSASKPYRLQNHLFCFPLAGCFPYKGFFHRDKAEELQNELIIKGYDTDISLAAGWSTLGIMKNPLHSHMLKRSPGRLADLIIHELTHNTMYIKHKGRLNENLASFIAYYGTQHFLTQWQKDSTAYLQYERRMADYKRYYRHWVRGARELSLFYDSIERLEGVFRLQKAEKQAKKRHAIEKIVRALDTIAFFNPSWKKLDVNKINNTFFMGYLTYRGDESLFDSIFSVHGKDIRIFVEKMKERAKNNAWADISF